MDWIVELEYLVRVLVALALGFCVGLERKLRSKEVGIRTHSIVCLGAAAMTIIGKYGFEGADGARVAAQIVTGIGFLGAGIIMYRRDSLRGATTAAGIWATAGIGMASGVGMYILAVGTAALIIILQCVLHLRIPGLRTKRFYIYRIKFNCAQDENKIIKEFFGINTYSRINYYNAGNCVSAVAEISTGRIISDDDIKKMLTDYEFITSVERIFQLDPDDIRS